MGLKDPSVRMSEYQMMKKLATVLRKQRFALNTLDE